MQPARIYATGQSRTRRVPSPLVIVASLSPRQKLVTLTCCCAMDSTDILHGMLCAATSNLAEARLCATALTYGCLATPGSAAPSPTGAHTCCFGWRPLENSQPHSPDWIVRLRSLLLDLLGQLRSPKHRSLGRCCHSSSMIGAFWISNMEMPRGRRRRGRQD